MVHNLNNLIGHFILIKFKIKERSNSTITILKIIVEFDSGLLFLQKDIFFYIQI